MDPSSPPYAHSEYFTIQPDFVYDNYPHDNAVVHVDGIHNPDSRINFGNLNTLQLSAGLPTYPYQPPSYIQSIRQHHPHSDLDDRDSSPMHSISPPLTSMSTSDLSGADSSASINALPPYQTTTATGGGGRSTGTSSPASSHGRVEQASTLVHRRALRGNSTSSVTAMSTTAAAAGGVGMTRERRKAAPRRSSTSASNTAADDDFASDEDDLPHASHETSVSKRREEVRKQRIESEQRRRDELRDGYRRLKDVLPVSNQKSSKVSLLDRATTHIRQLEMTQTHMIMKINELEAETARLRNVNETLMLSAAEQRRSSTGSGAF